MSKEQQMPRKALLLCAGMGSRLRPITYTSAKHVLPVANKPIIFYTIEALKSAGINDVGIVVGVNRHELMLEVGNGSRWGISITYIVQDNPLGTAHAVKLAEEWAAGEPFVMVLGDIMVENSIAPMLEEYRKDSPTAMLVLNHTDEPHKFGIAEVQNEQIVGIEEKPENPKSDLALAGIYLFNSQVFEAIDKIEESPRGELELPDAIGVLMAEGNTIKPYMLQGWWKDTGRPEDIIDVNRLLLDQIESRSIDGYVDKESSVVGRVVLHKTASLERSIVRGPAIIGPRAQIRDAYIGPYTSIGSGVSINGSEVEYSVVMEGSTIRGIRTRIESSLIGKNVTLTHAKAMPNVNNFVIGDNCLVSLV